MAKKEKQKHLGRGLQSLISPISNQTNETVSTVEEKAVNMPQEQESDTTLRMVQLEDISANPYQPRKDWNEQELADLVESVRANGIIQPIILRRMAEGYQLIAGERRWRAAKIAELENIPAVIREATEAEMLELALVENIHRSNLNPVERAIAYKEYVDEFKLTQSQAAQRLGESRSVIANFIRLLDLPQEIKDMLVNGDLSMGHARAILALPNDDLRRKLANRAMAGRLSVREVERLVKKALQSGTVDPKPKEQNKPPYISELERKLRDELNTKVQIKTQKNGKKGKIIIDFYSLDEFDRLSEIMGLSVVDED